MPRRIKPPACPRRALARLKLKRERLALLAEARAEAEAARKAEELRRHRRRRARRDAFEEIERRHAEGAFAPKPPAPATQAVFDRVDRQNGLLD
jgi:hypothetical protein